MLLLQAGARVAAVDRTGATALLRATRAGSATAVARLLAAPASHDIVNKADRSGETPLNCAASGGHSELCKALLKAGARINSGDK